MYPSPATVLLPSYNTPRSLVYKTAHGFYMHEVVQGQGMRNAEMLVWAGDFNYRIDVTYEDAIDHIRCNDLEYLLERVCNLLTSPFSSACADPAHHSS